MTGCTVGVAFGMADGPEFVWGLCDCFGATLGVGVNAGTLVLGAAIGNGDDLFGCSLGALLETARGLSVGRFDIGCAVGNKLGEDDGPFEGCTL
jgi:hypothetical protein